MAEDGGGKGDYCVYQYIATAAPQAPVFPMQRSLFIVIRSFVTKLLILQACSSSHACVMTTPSFL